MGRIKSAAEIAMEKTAGLASPENAPSAAEQYSEYIKAAGIMATSVAAGKTDLDKLQETMGKYPTGARQPVAEKMFTVFADEINMENTSRLLEAIRILAPDDQTLLRACADVEKIYNKTNQTVKEELSNLNSPEMQKKILAEEQIKGSAIYQAKIKHHKPDKPYVPANLEEDYLTQISGFRSFLAEQSRK